jgi:surface antigen
MENPVKSNFGGRVTEMLKNTGISGPAFWCAAAVTTWWKAAGMSVPPGPASCQNWMNWAKQNNKWSATPVIGAAAIYTTKGGRAHHIGLVAEVTNNGRIVTIEGNTTGGGFNRDGVGVFKKNPKLTSIAGFVLPA